MKCGVRGNNEIPWLSQYVICMYLGINTADASTTHLLTRTVRLTLQYLVVIGLFRVPVF